MNTIILASARGLSLGAFSGGKGLDHPHVTCSAPGRVGVWTEADSVVHVDDLRRELL